MLAVGGGRLICMSTPNGRKGWFYEAWHYDAPEDWLRVKVTVAECPRISETFLAAERRKMGDARFRQEYLCEFVSSDDQLLDSEDIAASFEDTVPALKIRVGL